MTEEENKLEEAAEEKSVVLNGFGTFINNVKKSELIEFAKSKEVKEYHNKGMIKEEHVKKLCEYAMDYAQDNPRKFAYELINEWFENNKDLPLKW